MANDVNNKNDNKKDINVFSQVNNKKEETINEKKDIITENKNVTVEQKENKTENKEETKKEDINLKKNTTKVENCYVLAETSILNRLKQAEFTLVNKLIVNPNNQTERNKKYEDAYLEQYSYIINLLNDPQLLDEDKFILELTEFLKDKTIINLKNSMTVNAALLNSNRVDSMTRNAIIGLVNLAEAVLITKDINTIDVKNYVKNSSINNELSISRLTKALSKISK